MLPIDQFDIEEQSIIDAVESGKLKRTKDFTSLKSDLEISAKIAREKKPVTLRFDRTLLNRIRAQAIEEGLPYQTYIQSVLHKHVPTRK